MNGQARPVKFWEIRDDLEQLHHRTPDEAIATALEYELVKPGGRIQLYGFAPMAHEADADLALETVLERLEEELGDPDGDGAEPTEKMREAARVFAAAIDAEYEPWACELVETRWFDVPAGAVEGGA